MTTIQALIWDMGGVLLRTEDYTPRKQLAERYGLTLQELEKSVFDNETGLAATLGQIPEELHWQTVFDHLKVIPVDYSAFQQQFWAGDRIDADLVAWIADLRSRYKIGLLSNAWSNVRKVVGSQFHFLHVFDDTIFSAEVGLGKPDIAIYQLAACRLGVSPESCVFIDDVAINIEGAIRAGMMGIQFKNSVQVRQELLKILND
jgi:epoxide hydrolase-like predicted phosphatase